MIKFLISNYYQNKKTTLVFLFSIIMASMLIFLMTLLFSVVHHYLVHEVKEKNGDYHVKIKTDLQNYENFSVIKKVKWEDDFVFITYNDIYDVYTLTDKLCKEAKCAKIEYNDVYLSLYGISKDENLLNTLKKLIMIVLLIILISSFFIIYNVYKILLVSKKKQIGILQSIGLTSRQLKIMLLVEALFYSLIGILIGFILSLLIMIIMLSVINNLLKIDIAFACNFKFLFYGFLFLFILIIFICFLPIIKIKKISNLKLLNDNYKNKKTKKINNIISFLAHLNYKRSKNHRGVIISLVIFIILTSSFSMFLGYGKEIINNYVIVPKYDAEVTIFENSDEAYKLLEDFAHKHASKYKIYQTCQKKVKIDQKNYLDNGPQMLNVNIIKGDNYFINQTRTVITKNNKIFKEEKSYFKDKISLNIDNKNINLVSKEKVPFGFENMLSKNNLIIGVSNINEICEPNLTLFMNSDDDLEKELKTLLKNDKELYYVNAKQGKIFINNIILGIQFFLYGILILTFLVGISIMTSSSFLSMIYRKKEFGLLKCMGFSSKQFKEMIVVESLYITIMATLSSLPIIMFINFITSTVIKEVIDVKQISIIKPFLFSVLICMIMTRIIKQLCYKKTLKSSVLNLINNDNI